MTAQMAFDLPFRVAMGAEDFIVTDSNRIAVGMIDAWPEWPSRIIILHGAPGSGKTHLARVWETVSGAHYSTGEAIGRKLESLLGATTVIIDGIDRIVGNEEGEHALFHLCNHIQQSGQQGGHMLLTALNSPARLPFGLPDLRSRILSYGEVEILPPDDILLAALLIKHFNDRQLHVDEDVIGFLLPRIERSADAVRRIVAALDAAALARKSGVTVPLARLVLEQKI
ncbi:MAG: DnaA/Hda family protein [Alphaproteobacteria bacterium]